MKEIYTFYKKMLPILALLLVCSTKLWATDYYWIGKAGDHRWATPGNWATTSGAAVSDLLYSPTMNDNVIFDQNSFTTTQKTVVIDATAYCDSLVFRGAMAAIPTLTFKADIYIGGSMLLYPGMNIEGNDNYNFYTLYFQSTRANETLGYTDNSDMDLPLCIDISGSANWVVNANLNFRSLRYSSPNVTVFSFSSTGDLTVNGNLSSREPSYNSPTTAMYFGGSGTKNITGNFDNGASVGGVTFEYGPVNIGGDFICTHLFILASHISILKGSVVTVEGDMNMGATIGNSGSELCIKGSIINADYIEIFDDGTLNNLGNKDIILGGIFSGFSCNNGILLGLSGITVQCGSWSNEGTAMTAAIAPALIRVGYSFDTNVGDVYNNVEVYGDNASFYSSYNIGITRGTYNKITFLSTSGYYPISYRGSITTDSLIISAQSEFLFVYPTYVNKYLEIVPQPCGGMTSIGSLSTGAIVMGSGSNVNVKNTVIKNTPITGATPYAAVNSADGGGNSGWAFNASQGSTYYWVGGGGNWDDHQHWADVSGGAPASGCIPTFFDNVIFDEYSGLNNTDVVNTNGVIAYCDSMTWHNISSAPTFNIFSMLYVGGSLELNAGMNLSGYNEKMDLYSIDIWFVSNRAGETIKTNGVDWGYHPIIRFHSGYIVAQAPGAGNGGWTLLDDLLTILPNYKSNINGGCIIFDRGNLNFGGRAVTASMFYSNGSLNRTLNIANSVITLNSVSFNVSNLATYPSWTYSGTNSSVLTTTETHNSLIKINSYFDNSSSTFNFTAKSGDTYNNVELNNTSGSGSGSVSSGIFNKITLMGKFSNQGFTLTGTNLTTDSLLLSADLGTTYKLAANIKVNKYLQGPLTCGLQSKLTSDNSTARLITMGNGANVNLKNLLITRVNITGAQAPYPAPDCALGIGTETGWATSSTPGIGRYYWVGGTGNWEDLSHWSNSSGGEGGVFCDLPKSINTVVFDENSFTAANQSVTINNNAFCDSMLWNNIPFRNPRLYIDNIAYNGVTTLTISGSLLLQAGMSVQPPSSNPRPSITFNSTRAEETVKTNGVSLKINTLNFINTNTFYFPDGLTCSANVYFGKTNISNTAQWIFGGPLQTVAVYFNFGILDLSESGDKNEFNDLYYDAGTVNHNTARKLIIKDATIKIRGRNVNSIIAWNYDGILTAANSENSTINFTDNRTVTIQPSNNQMYNNVNFYYTGIVDVPAGAVTQFNRVIFQNTAVGISGTVNRGVYKYLQFRSDGTINNIEADTLYFNNSNEYIYTFTSNATSTINKKWYGSGSPCTQISVQSSDVNGLPTPATIKVKKEAATMEEDTLLLDFVRLNGIYFTDGAEYAKMKLGPGSPIETFAGRYYNNPVPGNITHCTFMTYDNKFRRLGPDVTLCYNDYPYEISSAYYVVTPTSTFEWKKGTTDGPGGIALNPHPETDTTTTSWIVTIPGDDVEAYWLKVLYPVLNGPPCPLSAYKLITPVNISAPVCKEFDTLCYGSTIADLVARIGTDILIYANPTGGSALNGATTLQNKTYYVSQTINDCEGIKRASIKVKIDYCSNVFQIWNWADLAYLNVLIDNKVNGTALGNGKTIDNYEAFVLMQNLVMPGMETTGSDGLGTEKNGYTDCPYDVSQPERHLGSYGYENYLGEIASVKTYDHTGNQLLVGQGTGWNLDRFAWDMTSPGNNTGWIPVGKDNTYPFTGNFDGQEFEIDSLWIFETDATNDHYLGLFGCIDFRDLPPTPKSQLKNLGVNTTAEGIVYDCGIPQQNYMAPAGVMVAHLTGEITNCYSTGFVGIYNTHSETSHVGGLIGNLYEYSSVTNCYSTVNVVATQDCGGLIGNVSGCDSITNCYATGSVTSIVTAGSVGIGGFVGGIIEGKIANCYATGNITATLEGDNARQFGAGGFLGAIQFYNPVVENCYSTGTVDVTFNGITTELQGMGGFIAGAFAGSINNCYATGEVIMKNNTSKNDIPVGGFVAVGMNTIISNSFAFSPSVTATTTEIARFVGTNLGATLTNNSALNCMLVNGDKKDTDLAAMHNDIHGKNISYTAATRTNASAYSGWNFTNTWAFVPPPGTNVAVTVNTNLPVLQAFNNTIPIFETTVQEAIVEDCENVFRIWNWADLAYLNVLIDNKVNGTTLGNGETIDDYDLYLLMRDLGTPDDINSYGKGVATAKNDWVTCPYPISQPERHLGCYGYENFISGATYDYTQLLVGNGTGWLLGRQAWDMTGNTGWIPVGTNDTYPFVGNFNGQGFEINSLWINEANTTNDHYIGLFGYADGGEIANLGIYTHSEGVVYDCIIPQKVFVNVGILAAYINEMKITNCHTAGSVASRNIIDIDHTHVGGLIATLDGNSSTITNCYSKANVESSANDCGGLIGMAFGCDSITNCYTTGNVQFTFISGNEEGAAVGGLIGSSASGAKVTNCYATGDLSATLACATSGFGVGGLIGSIPPFAVVKNCYATGDMYVSIDETATDISGAGGIGVGGFAGVLGGATINNAYTTKNIQMSINQNNDMLFVGGFIGTVLSFPEYTLFSEINDCYATGSVQVDGLTNNVRVGGFAGNNKNSAINNSFALNPTVDATGATNIARFAGYNDGALTNNYALHCMTLNGDLVDPSDPNVATNLIHGDNIDFYDLIAPTIFKAAPYADAWDWATSWVFPGGGNVQIAMGTNLPVLQAFNKTKPIFENTVQKAFVEQCEKERYWVYGGDPENGAVFIFSYHWLQDAVNRVWTEDGGTIDYDDHGTVFYDGPVAGNHFFIVATEKDTNVTESGTYSPTTAVTIPEGMILTFTSLTGEIDTIIQPNKARHIKVMTGASLTLTNIIIEGKGNEFVRNTENDNGGIAVYNGELIVEEGAIIRKNTYYGGGGGVFLEGICKFTINDGEISNNETSGQGGGVYAYGSSEININGGKIKDNKSSNGGGVHALASYTYSQVSVIMTGGEITGNSGSSGGGVTVVDYYDGTSTFTMTGGKIYDNHADYSGGGVSLSCNFTMYDGAEISGNSALGQGGGVYFGNGICTMEGGLIEGNTAGEGGGVAGGGDWILNGGKIINNHAAFGFRPYEEDDGGEFHFGVGGGVFFSYGMLEMNGGIISQNTATGPSITFDLLQMLEYYEGVDVNDIWSVLGIADFSQFTLNEVVPFLTFIGVSESYWMGSYVANLFEYSDNFMDALTVLGLQVHEINYSNIVAIFTEMGIDGKDFIDAVTNEYKDYGISVASSGGGVFLEYDATFVMTGGKIFNNTASEDGGGIYTKDYNYEDPIQRYDNITIPNNCTDSVFGNHALAGRFVPPTEPAWDKAFEINLLNNDQINYRGETTQLDAYQIWNWADLQYLNVLVEDYWTAENSTPGDGAQTEWAKTYGMKATLMQDLGIPGGTPGVDFGDGLHGSATNDVPCPYTGPEVADRKLGSYGYENWNGTDNTNPAITLLVGAGNGWLLGREAWEETGIEGWIPVGGQGSNSHDDQMPFFGEFDGNGKTITGLWINRDASHQGLFGLIKNVDNTTSTQVHDLTIKIGNPADATNKKGIFGTTDRDQYYVAAFAGKIYGTDVPVIIENIKIMPTDPTVGEIRAVYGSGGLTGYAAQINVSGCEVHNLTISSHDGIDFIFTGGNAEDNHISGQNGIGGLIGVLENYALQGATSTISDCHVYGINVISGILPGGFIGYVYEGTILNCHAEGNVSGFFSPGGFVGGIQNFYNIEIKNCYFRGSVSGLAFVGGFVGALSRVLGEITIENCYSIAPVILDLQLAEEINNYVAVDPAGIMAGYSGAAGIAITDAFSYVKAFAYLAGNGTIIENLPIGGFLGGDIYIGGDIYVYKSGPYGHFTSNYCVSEPMVKQLDGTITSSYLYEGGSYFEQIRAAVGYTQLPELILAGTILYDSIASYGATEDWSTPMHTANMITKSEVATQGFQFDGSNPWRICDGVTYPYLYWQEDYTTEPNCQDYDLTDIEVTAGSATLYPTTNSGALDYTVLYPNGTTSAVYNANLVPNAQLGLLTSGGDLTTGAEHAVTDGLNIVLLGISPKDIVKPYIIRMDEEPATPFEIWNWADLQYINVLIENQNTYNDDNNATLQGNGDKLEDYDRFILMQDLGIPGEGNYGLGDGTGKTGKTSDIPCPYTDGNAANRKLGCYGYENWNGTDKLDPQNNLFVGTGNGWKLNRAAWDNGGWIPVGEKYVKTLIETGPGIPNYLEYDFSTGFKGKFDGQNFEINGLWIDRPANDGSGNYQGLFGYVYETTIENLGIHILDSVKGYGNVGGLVGCVSFDDYCTGPLFSTSTITNCYVTGNVSGSWNVGGLGGVVCISSVTNCYATGDITGDSWMVGGLFGYLSSNCDLSIPHSSVSNCYATGKVSGEGDVGGFAGFAELFTATNCYATGDVTGTGGLVGGFVGELDEGGAIMNCYATGNVTGVYAVGGFVGEKDFGLIENCYATGNVTAVNKQVGGLVGLDTGGDNIINCYALNCKVTSKTGTLAGRVVGDSWGTPLTISNYAYEEMEVWENGVKVTPTPDLDGMDGADIDIPTASNDDHSAYPAWDFSTVWDFVTPPGTNVKVAASTNLPVLRAFDNVAEPIFINTEQNPKVGCTPDCANPPTVEFDGPDEICAGTTTQLTPANEGWVSNDPTIATVDASGKVTALKAGAATFTFTDTDGCTATTTPLTVKPKTKISATIRVKN